MGCFSISSILVIVFAIFLLPDGSTAANPSPFRDASTFLRQRDRRPIFTTCDRYPRVCHAKGSPGPDCCKRLCVNVDRDAMNCGSCGNKCKFLEICCKGKCVSPLKDEKHCGGCDNMCKRGSKCTYGMCSYA